MNVTTETQTSSPARRCEQRLDFKFELPPFPTTAAQLVAELSSPEVEVSRVAQLIECEPTIGSRVLGLANSPLYATSRSISTISHAIVILGFKSVSRLALTVATGGMFNQSSAACAEARRTTYCQSLAIATVARLIARETKRVDADEAFLAGVMHDVGKLILFDAAGTAYCEMINDHPAVNIVSLESDAFGITHPELGMSCGKKWGLPPSINAAIANHHFPLHEVADPLSQTVIAANYFARKWQIGFRPEESFDIDERIETASSCATDNTIASECVEQFAAIGEICLS
jgi:putative nucleotidyltransferase with HDIG domain